MKAYSCTENIRGAERSSPGKKMVAIASGNASVEQPAAKAAP